MMFQSIDWPETCYVLEAAYWLAFGRVPFFITGDGTQDARMGVDARYGGELYSFDSGFSQDEFFHVGAEPFDYERYRDASYAYADPEHVAKMRKVIESAALWDGQTESELETWKAAKIKDLENTAEDARWAANLESVFHPLLDQTMAQVFLALSRGELPAYGWVGPSSDNDDVSNAFRLIPANQWSSRSFKWDDSELSHPGGEYRCVQVMTEDLLKVFPTPIGVPQQLVFDVYPGVAIARNLDGTEQGLSLRGRGRPPKAIGNIKTAVQNYFGNKLKKSNSLGKKEALIEEVIEFVKVTFKEEISRSTAQNYLSSLFANADRSNVGVPINNANK